MQPTSTAIAMPTSRPGVEPASAKTTQTATAATGGSHRTGTSHQSILDGYHRSCSADMDTPLSLALSARVAGHEFRHRRFAPSTSFPVPLAQPFGPPRFSSGSGGAMSRAGAAGGGGWGPGGRPEPLEEGLLLPRHGGSAPP